MTLPVKTNPHQTTIDLPSTTGIPSAGDIVRDGLTGDKVVVTAKAKDELRKLNILISEEISNVRKRGYILGIYFLRMSEERLYLAAGYAYMKSCLEGEYKEIGRTTVMRLMQIARAFNLRVPHGGLALPELCGLEAHKTESLARLPEEMRNSLREKGKFSYQHDGEARIVSVAELQGMTREEGDNIVAKVLGWVRLSVGAQQPMSIEPDALASDLVEMF